MISQRLRISFKLCPVSFVTFFLSKIITSSRSYYLRRLTRVHLDVPLTFFPCCTYINVVNTMEVSAGG